MSLSNNPIKDDQIQNITSLKRTAHYDSIKTLTENGLAIKTNSGYILGQKDLRELEHELGCGDLAFRRNYSTEKERSKDENLDFLDYLKIEDNFIGSPIIDEKN